MRKAYSFGSFVAAWVEKVEGAAEAVWKESAQEIIGLAQQTIPSGGNLPIDTGFLRASLQVSTTAMPRINPEVTGGEGSVPWSQGDIEIAVAGASYGETLYAGYTAAYALRMEYGFAGVDSLGRYYDQPGYAFVRKAAQNWQSIVAKHTRRLSATVALS